jgi:putative ABC transport system ATP-binding protein
MTRADAAKPRTTQRRSGVMGADLAIRDLVIEYSSGGYPVRPIDGMHLDCRAGELVLLLGASGCGKTTLLSVIAAILTPTSGSVRVGDTEVVGLKGSALTEYRRSRVGVVFQAFNLVPSLNAVENVMVPLRAAGVGRGAARERAEQLLRRVDLGDRLSHRPGDMSGGQQQRVAIARALAHDPPVLLADEPTAHLDYIQVEGVLKLVRELADDGHLVVVATHDDRLVPLADRVVNLTPRADLAPREPVHVSLEDGQMLFHQGDQGDLVYVVEEGMIDIVRTRDDDTEEKVAEITAGNYFGELAPLFGLRRSASARASGHTVVTGLGLREFRDQFHLADSKVLSEASD